MEENVKINFFKKIWYSIARPSKYEELRKLGVVKAIKFILLIIPILAFIIALFIATLHLNIAKDTISELDKKMPEVKFKENSLNLENGEATIINDKKITEYYKSIIVINPLIDKQEAINLYKDLATEKNNVMIFLNKEYVLISNKYKQDNKNEEGLVSQKYSDITSKFIKDTSYEYGKKDIIQYLRERTSYTYYLAQYFVVYFVMTTFLYLLYILLISIGMWLVTKLSKYKWTYKDSLMNTIYGSTLSLLVYVTYIIISYLTGFKINFMDVISIALIYIYLILVIWKQKNKKARV